jgi:hypothetical protein
MRSSKLLLSKPLLPSGVELTDLQIRFFWDNGFLRLESLTTPKEIAEIKSSLEPLFAKRTGESEGAFADQLAGAEANVMTSPQILNPVNYVPKLHQTQCFRNALYIARQLLGNEARCFFDLSIVKMPRIGAPTPWHQDEAFRDPNFEYNEVTIWVALQDVTLQNGCLQFVPGSHKGPVREHYSVNHDPTSQALETANNFSNAEVSCELPCSGCTIHHPRTLHRSTPNVSDAARFAYIMTFGIVPRPAKGKRLFVWRNEKQTIIQARKRKWMRRGGLIIAVWRRLRRGDLKNVSAAIYGLRRSLKIFRSGL